MSDTYERLRRLLPRYYWLRDDGTLDAVVRVLADRYDGLRLEVERLYDDVFLATCEPRFVPLIGAGIGVSGLGAAAPGVGDRAWVGRVLGLRRRKGMLATVGRGVSAATGWAAFAREDRAVLATTWSATAPDRSVAELLRLTGRPDPARLHEPWSPVPRSAGLSGRPLVAGLSAAPAPAAPAASPRPSGAAVWVWRLRSFPVRGRTACPAPDGPDGRAFRFDPLGRDTRLFAQPVPVADRLRAPHPEELPLPLTRGLLAGELRAGARSLAVAGCPRLAVADLGAWAPEPPAGADALVDPERGRLLLARPAQQPPAVDYAYGAPGELGGGPYGTAGDYAAMPADAALLRIAGPADLAAALADPRPRRVAIVEDSATYAGDWDVAVPAGGMLRLASAPEAAPVLRGDLRVRLERGARLELSGLTLGGTLTVAGEGEVAVEHATLAPRARQPSLLAEGELALALRFCVAGAIESAGACVLAVRDSILDGPVVAAGAVDLARVTALRDVRAATLLAADCLFAAPPAAEDSSVRASYLPAGSRVRRQRGCSGPHDGPPRFVSERWGDPAFCQLRLDVSPAIAAGGTDGGELGAWARLGQADRLARLPAVLDDLLPAGVGASVRYVT